MTSFRCRLSEAFRQQIGSTAVTPIEKIDPRLATDSELKPVKARQDGSKPGRIYHDMPKPPMGPRRKPQYLGEEDLSASLEQALSGSTEGTPEGTPEQTPAPEQAPAPQPEVPAAIPSGNQYTLRQAKGQLDGIIEKWMDMAGNLPDGEDRHNFLELGERLREISGVINRDFIETGKVS